MITSNCKQKENKLKEVSLLRPGVAHYVLAMSKTKKAVHTVVSKQTEALNAAEPCVYMCIAGHN